MYSCVPFEYHNPKLCCRVIDNYVIHSTTYINTLPINFLFIGRMESVMVVPVRLLTSQIMVNKMIS